MCVSKNEWLGSVSRVKHVILTQYASKCPCGNNKVGLQVTGESSYFMENLVSQMFHHQRLDMTCRCIYIYISPCHFS